MGKKASANTGFVKVNNSIMMDILAKTDPECLAIYVVILSHRNWSTNKCFPSRSKIAEETNVSEATVKRKIQKLYETGFLIINSGTNGVANNYYFPREDFFEEWKSKDIDQCMAKRKKKAITKAKKPAISPEKISEIDELREWRDSKKENTEPFNLDDALGF